MFIKFSDKTKKIIVKESKESSEDLDENAIYLDEDDEKNYRLKIIKKSLENKEK